ISDANHDGHASLLGTPFIQSAYVNGVLAGQQNTGCDLTGTPGFTAPCPSAAQLQAAALFGSQVNVSAVPPHGTLELDIAFALSDGDAAHLNGSVGITAAEVPEPGTGVLLAAGFIAVAGVASRRKARARRSL